MEMNASILTALYRNGLWISAPLFVVAAVLLGYFIVNVVRLEGRSQIISLPLAEQQNVAFGEAGAVVLHIQGPRFTTRFASLTWELSAEDGTPVTSRNLWLRPAASHVSTARLGIRVYEIPRPGNYVFRIHGLKDKPGFYDKCEIIFTRWHRARSIGNVIGIVFSAILLIGSAALFVVRLIVRA